MYIYILIISFLIVTIISFLRYKNKQDIKEILDFLQTTENKEGVLEESLNKIKKYYINLNASTDRRKDVESQIEKLKIENIERIEAVNYKEITDFKGCKVSDIEFLNTSKDGTIKELSCLLSHLKTIKKAYESGDEECLIFEDDINFHFSKLWNFSFHSILNSLDEDCYILSLTGRSDPFKVSNKTFEIKRKNFFIPTTISYLIKREGMKIVLDNILKEGKFYLSKETLPTGLKSDHFLFNKLKNNKGEVVPSLFLSENPRFKTTIHDINLFKDLGKGYFLTSWEKADLNLVRYFKN